MTDLVKQARDYANDPMWADHCEVRKDLMHKLADEIERLRKRAIRAEETSRVDREFLDAADKRLVAAKKVVIEDMRAWAVKQNRNYLPEILDAYAKDRKI